MKEIFSVKEIFYSIQGEGLHSGTPAVFIRFAGCNLRCPFCDTDFNNGEPLTAEQITERIKALGIDTRSVLLVLTGGEPTLQVTEELLEVLHRYFKTICIETNGSHSIPKGVDFVTVSPKQDFTKPYHHIDEADEVKLVYTGENNPNSWVGRISAKHYFLQPCDTGDERKNREIMQQVVAFVKKNPRWRISLQIHKILNVE